MYVSCLHCGAVNDVPDNAAFCPSCGHGLEPTGRVPAVELIDVCKSFGHVRVFDRLNFQAYAGENTVIVGMSGSGKSVLIEHIVGFLRPDTGSVRLFGIDLSAALSNQGKDQARRHVGMVFQGSALIDSLSVRENVMLPLTARGATQDEARKRANELLGSVGLSSTDGDLCPAQLSGGMQKRVGIARALISSPAILLYDEPTTGLDAATSNRISRLMRHVQETNPNLTSVTITHDYVSAGIIADRVLYLDRSRGALREVLSSEDIQAIRARHDRDGGAAVNEIRSHLEAFFDQLDFRERPPGPRTTEESFLHVFADVLTGAFGLIGAALLVLGRVGLKVDWSAVPSRFYHLGVQSLLVTCSAGFFVGMMLALQIGMGLAGTGVLEPLPRIIGITAMEKIGPLVIGLLVAGRVGASVSADIGGKRLSRQFDALRSMRVSPERYWLLPILVAIALAMPLLAVALEFSSLAGAYTVAVARYHVNSSLYLDQVLKDVRPMLFGFGLVRSVVFGLAIALLAYVKGAEEKRSSEDIGTATTIAVSAGSVAVIVLDFVMVFVISGR